MWKSRDDVLSMNTAFEQSRGLMYKAWLQSVQYYKVKHGPIHFATYPANLISRMVPVEANYTATTIEGLHNVVYIN